MAVKHVVLFKFKVGLSREKQDESFELLRALKEKIPVVKHFEGGPNISREGRSQGLTHGFVMTLADRKAVTEYLEHPEHEKTVNQLLPLIENLLVVDFEM